MASPSGTNLAPHTIYLRPGLIDAIRTRHGSDRRAAEAIRTHLELLARDAPGPTPASAGAVLALADSLAEAARTGLPHEELERGMTERAQTARSLRWMAQTLRRLSADRRPAPDGHV